MNLESIQDAVRTAGVDGWLFVDFRRREPFAYDVLGLPAGTPSRRWAYFVPARGAARKILHRIEPRNLAALPGEAVWYSTWSEWRSALGELLAGSGTVAMQYSPMCELPYLSTVDAGTVELVRSCGVKVVSSDRLVARFQGLIDGDQMETHRAASVLVHTALADTFTLIRDRARSGDPITERAAADFIERRFAELGLQPEGHGPNVSAGANAANPHYDPPAVGSLPLTPGTPVLIDLWAKLKGDERAVVFDITWCAWLGDTAPPPEYVRRFDTVVRARDEAEALIRARYAAGEEVRGCDADDACRAVVNLAGYGPHFTHRTGHAIDTRTHGGGVNLDNFESRDTRPLLPGACFSIEPGIYEGIYGVRSEINMLIDLAGNPQTFGPKQSELLLL